MVTLIVNPTVVTLTLTENELNIPIVKAEDGNGLIVAEIAIVHSIQNPRLSMRDYRTNIVYESESIDKDDVLDINYLLEYMLNQANLTHIQRIPK